jgi:hypothetical protein
MARWDAFAAAAPDLEAAARRLLERADGGSGLLATVDGAAGLPRVHPVYVRIVGGRLLTAVLAGSPKLAALDADGRYALHGHQERNEPHEVLVRGHARRVSDPAARAAAVEAWPFSVAPEDAVFELGIAHVVLGERGDPDAWPPRYRSWRATEQ